MISFRYHIVSIVAVFLALALGIVVGTTALNGPITKDLRNQVDDAKKQRDDLAGQVKTLQGQVDDAGEFASTYGSQLVANTLTGKSILVVSLPGTTPGMRDGVSAQIDAAGGKVSGDIAVTKAYLDSSRSGEINSLATGPVRPLQWTAPETGDAGKLGGSLLAFVLLGKGQATDTKQVISAFSERHLIDVEGSDITASTSIVVLGRGALKGDSYASKGQLALVDALVAGGGKVVVAGDDTASDDAGVIAAVRDDSADRDSVSTVDDANSAFGQVSTTLALASAIKGQFGHYGTLALASAIKGQFGHYGTQDGADALFPTPAR